MPLVERVYSPLPKDVQSGLNQRRRIYTMTNSGTTTLISANTASTPILPGVVFIATGWQVQLTPGAAQRFLFGQILIRDENAGVVARFAGIRTLGTVIAAAIQERQSEPCDIILLPGDSLDCTCTFDAGANSNALTATVWGYELPRGNVER